MTLNEFKKAVKKSVEQCSYASEIMKAIHIEDYSATGRKLGYTNVAIISVYNDMYQRSEYRVYYNYSTMKGRIDYTFYDDYFEACDNFERLAR